MLKTYSQKGFVMHRESLAIGAVLLISFLLVGCRNPDGQPSRVKIGNIVIEIPQRNRIASLSPDGALLAYDIFENGQDLVKIRNLNTEQEKVLSLEGMNLKAPKWSPDGGSILMHGITQDAVQLVQYIPSTGKFVSLTRLEQSASRGDWHPDGRKIAYVSDVSGSYDIFVLDLETQRHSKITTNPGNEYWPRWSPDGAKIAFYHTWNEWTNLAIVTVATGRVEGLTDNEHEDYRPIFSMDGGALYFLSDRWNDGGIGYYDLETDEVANIGPGIQDADYIIPLSDGSGLFHALQIIRNTYEISRHGTRSEIQSGEGDRSGIALTPNGDRLVYAAWHENSRQIFSMNLDGSDIKRHTDTRHHYASPFYTQDGALWVLRSGGDYQHSRLGVLDLDSGEYVEKDDSPSTRMPAACGDHIYFLSSNVAYQSTMTLFELDYRTGAKRRVTDRSIEVGGIDCAPDGRILAAIDFDGDVDLAMIEPKSGNVTRFLELEGTQIDPAVSPDGGRIAFATRDGNYFQVAVVDRASPDSVSNISADAGQHRHPVWLSDDALIWVKEQASTRWVISTFE